MDFTDRPTAELIDRLVIHLGKLWEAVNDQNRIVDTYINQTARIWPLGLDRPAYYSPTASAKVNMAVATQLAYEPTVSRNPVGRGEKSREAADLVEPWLRAAFKRASLEEPVLPWKAGGRNLIAYGRTVFEGPLWVDFPLEEPEQKRREADRDFEKRLGVWKGKKAAWFPIRIKAPALNTVLMDPWVKTPGVALRLGTRYAGDLTTLTQRKAELVEGLEVYQNGDNPFKVIDVIEFWSDYWHVLKVKDGGVLYQEENETGFVPYCHGYAGFGGLPSEHTEQDVLFVAQGILQPVLDTLTLESQALNTRQNAMMVAGWPQAGTKRDTAETAQMLNRGGMLPGERVDYWYRESPEFPAHLFQSEAMIRRAIEEGTYPSSLAGYREAGVSTVGQQAILTEAADKRFRECREQLNHLATIVGQRILQLVDLAGVDVSIDGRTVGPEEIKHNYNVSVKFELLDPVLQMQQDQLNLAKVAAHLMSAETYWATSRLEDASGEKRRLLEEEIDRRPEVHEFLVRQAMREKGLADLVDELEAREEAARAAAAAAPPPGSSGLVGPSGGPLPVVAAPMGQPTGAPVKPGGAAQAASANRGLRQMLTPSVAKPALRRR